VATVELLGDGQADHGVAEELEAFVVAGRFAGMLVQPRGVRQGLGDELAIPDREVQALDEGVDPIHGADGFREPWIRIGRVGRGRPQDCRSSM
jgi:hypothetical protein